MTKEFLNEAKLQFKYCSREDQHILLDAWLDGNCEAFNLHFTMQGWSSEYNEQVLKANWTLRTKPVKRLAIPWEHIKPEYRWAAMDEDEQIFLYEDMPTQQDDDGRLYQRWISRGDAESAKVLNIDTSGISWRDSLVERPADK